MVEAVISWAAGSAEKRWLGKAWPGKAWLVRFGSIRLGLFCLSGSVRGRQKAGLTCGAPIPAAILRDLCATMFQDSKLLLAAKPLLR